MVHLDEINDITLLEYCFFKDYTLVIDFVRNNLLITLIKKYH